VKVGKAKAAQLYAQAAEQGNAEAHFFLCACFAYDDGVKLDKAKAAQLVGQVVEQGHAEAQYTLGTCYEYGEGVMVDKAKAVQLYGQAAGQGHADAQWFGFLACATSMATAYRTTWAQRWLCTGRQSRAAACQ
jgi:TPR repeat protein